MERVHLSNRFGTTAITVGAARIAAAVGQTAAIDATQDHALTFGGSTSVTIQPGQDIVSDPVLITYTYGQHLSVSIYVQGAFPSLTQHESQVGTNFNTPVGAGNSTADSAGTSFSVSNSEWFLLSGVDVFGLYQGTVAIFGSSSVDGHNSNTGNTNTYPTDQVVIPTQDNDRPSDWLARQMIAAGYNVGVLNAGMLADPAGPDPNTTSGRSVAGIDRFGKDVLAQANVKAVVIYIGGIDIRQDCEPATMVEGYLQQMVTQAQSAGVRVVLATLPPSEYCQSTPGLVPSAENPYVGDINPGPENPGSTQRNLLNAWIRTTGAQLPGVVGIADFDKVLADPTHPDFMIPNLNSGDNFHPDGAGYGVQSSAIPLGSLLVHRVEEMISVREGAGDGLLGWPSRTNAYDFSRLVGKFLPPYAILSPDFAWAMKVVAVWAM